MNYNKVVLSSGSVLIDLTADSVAPEKLLSGITAHDKSGAQVTGTLTLNSVHSGSGAPSASMGADGDYYFDLG